MEILNPYPFTKTHNREYHFTTKNRTEYAAYFNKVPVESGAVYNFVFAISHSGAKRFDLRIRDTIVCIIFDFWEDYDNVTLFVCDSSDGRARNRMRLFNYWYKLLNCDGDVVKIDFLFKEINAAILAKKDNCLLELVENEISELFDLMSGE